MAIGLLTPSTGLTPQPIEGGHILLDVGHGLFSLIDRTMLPRLEDYSWRATLVKKSGLYYVYGYKAGKYVPLHRLLLDLEKDDPRQGDHCNGFTLDNRMSNLRIATRPQNATNRQRHRPNSTGYVGVSLHGPSGKYMARIRIDGKRTCLGYFDTPEEAAAAYTVKHKELVG